jgi:hypothetical protein
MTIISHLSTTVVPVLSLLRLDVLEGDPLASALFRLLTSRDMRFSSRTSSIVFEELIVATLFDRRGGERARTGRL